MRIAIVGAGVSGLTALHLLGGHHEVDLFEANDYPGGHTHTHDLEYAGRRFRVDSGFIVFNPDYYPLFSRLLAELGVRSRESEMSFSVRNDASGLEYNATDLPGLFCQRRNLVKPRFWRMLTDLVRFYRAAPGLLDAPPSLTTGEYLRRAGYSQAFARDHLVPMAAALWSAPPSRVPDFPIGYMVRFFANHRMLQLANRPPWQTVADGSATYVSRLLERAAGRLHLATPVERISRTEDGWRLRAGGNEADYDRVILACHSDQALALLAAPDPRVREVLGAIGFQRNETVLHTDTRVLPRSRRAWAAWNARVPRDPDRPCTVTYHMNVLQRIEAPVDFLVTLNQGEELAPSKVLARMTYHHPVYDVASVRARERFEEVDGRDGLHFCGAWWGWGFHEDGVRSAVRVCEKLGVSWRAAA